MNDDFVNDQAVWAAAGFEPDSLDDATRPLPVIEPGEASGVPFPLDTAPRPVVWPVLDPDQLEAAWLDLNEWVEDIRQVFAIPAAVIPPFWHRHQLLVEHLSALRTHWLAAYDPAQHGSAPFGWLRDLDEWKNRMREAVSQLGCRIDTCRPETAASWPGEPETDPADQPPPVNLADRYQDFVTVVCHDVYQRRRGQDRLIAQAAQDGEGEAVGVGAVAAR
jgi:hypothetical protein